MYVYIIFTKGDTYMRDNRKIKRIFTSAVALLLVLCALLCIASCNGNDKGSETSDNINSDTAESETQLSYDDVDVNKYVKSVTYKDLKLNRDENQTVSDEELVWEAILNTAEMYSYPEDKVEYFFNQMKRSYMYLVNYNEEDYELLLKNRSTTEEDMRAEARKMVKKDLVYHYIVQKENIVVSDEEKAQLFDKYVDKYVGDYGYNKDYVEANMTSLIYESMLYDKTMEFLFISNGIEVADTAESSAEK